MKYIKLFIKEDTLQSVDGNDITVLRLDRTDEESVLDEWANHFRDNYRSIEDVDFLREGTGESREDYFLNHVFPNPTKDFGPSVRVGDFCELLVADYLQFIETYYVPRVRYCMKANPNESTQLSDVLGFKMSESVSNKDTVSVIEVKGTSNPKSEKKSSQRLQDAINDSSKDLLRYSEAINSTIMRLRISGDKENAVKLRRFQNIVDRPYLIKYGATAVLTDSVYDPLEIVNADSSAFRRVKLMVIHTKDLKALINEIYRRAAYNAN